MGACYERSMRSIMTAILVAIAAGATAAEPWTVDNTEADKVKNPVVTKQRGASAERGKVIYLRDCATCHGSDGKGVTKTAALLETPPGDMTTTAFAQQSDGSVFVKITKGRPPMPGYRRSLTDTERWDLVNFVRALRGGRQRSQTPKP